MTKTQRDLLAACWNKKINPTYDAVRGYAYNFKKYDNMRMSEIDEVIDKLEALGLKAR